MGSHAEDYMEDKNVEKLPGGDGSGKGKNNNQNIGIQIGDCCQGVEGVSCTQGNFKGENHI